MSTPSMPQCTKILSSLQAHNREKKAQSPRKAPSSKRSRAKGNGVNSKQSNETSTYQPDSAKSTSVLKQEQIAELTEALSWLRGYLISKLSETNRTPRSAVQATGANAYGAGIPYVHVMKLVQEHFRTSEPKTLQNLLKWSKVGWTFAEKNHQRIYGDFPGFLAIPEES